MGQANKKICFFRSVVKSVVTTKNAVTHAAMRLYSVVRGGEGFYILYVKILSRRALPVNGLRAVQGVTTELTTFFQEMRIERARNETR